MNLAALLDRAARTGPERAARGASESGSCRPTESWRGTPVDSATHSASATDCRQVTVSCCSPSIPGYIECLFACWRAGLIAVPVNAKLHPQEVAYVLSNSGARAAFVSADLTTVLQEAIRAAGTTISVDAYEIRIG